MADLSFVSIEVDKKTLDEVKFMLATVKNGAEKALQRAANQTAVTARERIVRTVQSRVNLTYTRIKKDTTTFKARPGSTTAYAVIFRRQIKAIEFPNLSSLVGTSVAFRKNRKDQLFRHAFRAKMKSGHIGIFERGTGKRGDSNAGNRPAGRLRIEEIYGPGVGNVFHFNDEKVVFDEMTLLFQKRLIERAEYLLSRAR